MERGRLRAPLGCAWPWLRRLVLVNTCLRSFDSDCDTKACIRTEFVYSRFFLAKVWRKGFGRWWAIMRFYAVLPRRALQNVWRKDFGRWRGSIRYSLPRRVQYAGARIHSNTLIILYVGTRIFWLQRLPCILNFTLSTRAKKYVVE